MEETIATPIVKKPRTYFFKKGNKFGKGSPPTSRHQLEVIRRRIYTVVRRRIFHEKDLETVSTTDLLKFFASIIPKEAFHVQAPQINYISNVPREEALKEVIDFAKNNTELPAVNPELTILQPLENEETAGTTEETSNAEQPAF